MTPEEKKQRRYSIFRAVLEISWYSILCSFFTIGWVFMAVMSMIASIITILLAIACAVG